MAIDLAPVFQTVGDFGGSVARARLAATQYKLQQLLDQLGLKQGETNLEESQERLRRLKAEPESESAALEQKFAAFEKILKRPLSENEKKLLMGIPWQAERNPIQEKIDETEAVLHRKLTDDEKNILSGLQPKPAATKPAQTKTYDPAGNLRYAWTNTDTGEVQAWGGLVPENDQIERWTDEAGNIHVLRMEKFRKVDPGTIRMTEKAEKQWQTINEAAPRPGKQISGQGSKAGSPIGRGGSTVIGSTTPKYSTPLNASLKDAKSSYDEWIKASKNAEYHTPRTDLAIVFSAVRAAVQGAGRMTNVEMEKELQAGSYGDRFRRQWDMATKGTLPDDQREDLLRTIRNAWMAKAQSARTQWKTEMHDKALPLFIQGEDINPLGNTPAGGGDLYFDAQGNPVAGPPKKP